jgi:hypothetical protein
LASAVSFRPGHQTIVALFDQLPTQATKRKKRGSFSLLGATNLLSSIRFYFTFQDLP